MNSNNFFQLVAEFQKNIDWLNQILIGTASETITIDGEVKPTISKDIADKWLDLSLAQRQGLVAFATYAELTSYTPPTDQRQASFKVGSDPDATKNGYYRWVSGTTYEKDADLVLRDVEPTDTSLPVSGAAVADYAAGASSFTNITGSFVDNSLINAVTGSVQSNTDYKRTDYIKVTPGMQLTYIGACKSMTGFCFYDKAKKYISDGAFWPDLDPTISILKRRTVVVPSNGMYFRACFDKREPNTANAAIMTLSIPVNQVTSNDDVNVQESVNYSDYLSKNERIDLIEHSIITDNQLIDARNGDEVSNDEYHRSDYIPVDSYPWDAIFNGYLIAYAGIAGYDENKQFVASVLTPADVSDSPIENFKIKITDTKIKYIRACSKKSVTPIFEVLKTYSGLSFNSLFEDSELINDTNTIDGEMVDASNGNSGSNPDYERTDFIPVEYDVNYRWSGYVVAQVGIVGYDENKQYVDAILWPARDGFEGAVEAFNFTVTDNKIKYIRACSKKSVATKDFCLKLFKSNIDSSIKPRLEMIESKLSYLDLVNYTKMTKGEGINTSNGQPYKNDDCSRTDFIPVFPGQNVIFTGRNISMTGTAGYGKGKEYITAISPGAETLNAVFTVPDGVYFIRSTTYEGYPLSLESTIKAPDVSESSDQDIVVEFIEPTKFFVHSRCPDGSYATHEFLYVDRPQFTDRGWYSPWVYHNGNTIGQGNINMIHIMHAHDGSDDDMYVGVMHGCELDLYTQFYIDGVEFDPTTAKDVISGTRFRVQSLSKFYTPDKQASIDSGTPSTVAALPLEERAQRVTDFSIYGNNKITRNNKLKVLKDGVTFSQLFGAMQQTNPPVMNGVITTNDKDGLRNHFPTAPEQPEALAPSTVVMNGTGYGDKNSFCTSVSAAGEDDNYSYLMTTVQQNADGAQHWKNHIRAWLTRVNAHKMYFLPIITSDIASAYPEYQADVFNIGDVIESVSETTLMVTKK
ncbi:hypothetical protein D0856_20940 [Vibrio owensii]|uniref:hypothetical protein n=1 Tax=Vibrio owensii TaxID=696485 RepID=UPI000EFAA484|nr:hypothetical protein [Vibrio owensii]AYO22428.1 hypothetical protein D0856_20940 [Vibrio owensii]